MSLIATWLSEARWAQHPHDPRYPLGLLFDASAGGPCCEVALEHPTPCVGKWITNCDLCKNPCHRERGGRPDDPYTVRLACKLKGSE
jgi:hypothetical protein